MLAAGDAAAVGGWIDRARVDRDALLGAGLTGAAVHELRVHVPNRPGVIAEIALALGEAGVNIGDLALSPSRDKARAWWRCGSAAMSRRRGRRISWRASASPSCEHDAPRMNVRFEPAAALTGTVAPPADKSISHRAALLGAMSSEPVRITNYLQAADTTSTLEAVRSLGALVEQHGSDVVIRGTGLREAREPEQPIDVGNAGTLLRLLPGWLAAQQGRSFTLDGDESIRRRPVDRIAEPLRLMGAELEATGGRFAPLTIRGQRLRSVAFELEVASAQVKSCVLLAGLAADGATTVAEPTRSRDHTERMLLRAGVSIHRNGRHVTAVNADELQLEAVTVPADPSSAAFLIAAGVLVPGSRLLLSDVGVNWTRTGFIRILRRMRGIVLGDLEREQEELSAEEPVSDLDVAHGALEGTIVTAERGAAGDRRAAARRPARLLRRGPDGRRGRSGAAREGVRPHRRRRGGAERAGRRDRGDRGRLRRDGDRWAAGRHDRQPRRSPPGDGRRRRRAGLARGGGGDRHGRRRGLLPALPRRSRGARRRRALMGARGGGRRAAW